MTATDSTPAPHSPPDYAELARRVALARTVLARSNPSTVAEALALAVLDGEVPSGPGAGE
jgi:hypothetical protein